MSSSSHNPYPVDPTGYLIGSFAGAVLFGCHTAQVYRYYVKFRSDPWRLRLLVGWIYTLSSLQILIIVSTAWKYFVDGIHNPNIWREFWWPLSFQDGLVPIVAFTAQCYFARRAYILLGRQKWFLWLTIVWSSITAVFGVALAATAFVWARDPWVNERDFSSRVIGVPSQVVAITWMGLSAALDGILTVTLIRCLWRSRSPTMDRTNDLIRQLITLTLETVLLTHICGAVMCVLFLSQPAQHRTKTTAFWICLEIITELYSLSVVFTINARSSARRTFHGPPPTPIAPPPPTPAQPTLLQDTQDPRVATKNFTDQRRLDFAVEGMQEISRFSYHFPSSADRGRAAGKSDAGLNDDELLELNVLPMMGDLESAPENGMKLSEETVSVSARTSGEYQGEVKNRRNRIALWGGRK